MCPSNNPGYKIINLELLSSNYLNSLFQNIPLFFCPLVLKISLKPQIKINKTASENGVIYHPTGPSGSRSKIKAFWGFAVLFSTNFVEFSIIGANPTMVSGYFQINGAQILVFRKPLQVEGHYPFPKTFP